MDMTESKLLNSFNDDVVKGDYGESWTVEAYKKLKGISLIKCDTAAHRNLDIDFTDDYNISICDDVDTIKNTDSLLIEVKTDYSKFKNQCIEVVSNTNTNSKGWALVTEAKYIVSVFPNLNLTYVYDGKKFREYAEKICNDDSVKTVKLNTASYNGKKLYNTIIKLVRRKTLFDLGIILEIYDMSSFQCLYRKDNVNHIH